MNRASVITCIAAVLVISGCSGDRDASAQSVTAPPAASTTPTSVPTPSSTPTPNIVVPDLMGMPGAKARQELATLGLVGWFAPVDNLPEMYDRGHWIVKNQSPEAGTSAQPGAEVTFVAAQIGPLASEVIAAFKAKGLPVSEPRDNTQQNCYGKVHECVMLMTTEDVSVYEFANEADGQGFVKVFGAPNVHQKGTIVLSYLAARTPERLRPRYEAALTQLMAKY